MAVAAAALAACLQGSHWTCDGSETVCTDGVPVYFPEPGALGTPEVAARVGAQLACSLEYWGVLHQRLDGWRIVYVRDAVTCGAPESTNGCFDPHDRTITLWYWSVMGDCFEAAFLPHEIGHFTESGHASAKWCGFEGPAEQLQSVPACAGSDWHVLWSWGASCGAS